MLTRQTVMAPEPILRAALRVVFVASYTTRNWTRTEEVPRQRVYDLWEAIHEVPDLVCRWRADAERELLMYFDEYDAKWPDPKLRAIYQAALETASRHALT
jgi:hypothetical protein